MRLETLGVDFLDHCLQEAPLRTSADRDGPDRDRRHALTDSRRILAGGRGVGDIRLTNAFTSPQISRLIDRLGQTTVVTPATIVSVLAFIALIVAANQHWPAWTLFATAFLAGTMPSIPAMVRARWTEIFRHRPELNTAFAFESAADELVYIAGASLSVGLAVALFPEAGMLISTIFLALGTAAFILQRSTEPRVRSADSQVSHGSAIRLPAVQVITLALVFVGSIFAAAEVSAVAITMRNGDGRDLDGALRRNGPGKASRPCASHAP
jgi:MFS family permease